MMTEDRLRDLLNDPRWALPAWPDAHARVRRAARRQRLTLAGVGAVVTAVITTAAVVPVMLLSRGAVPAGPPGGSYPLATPPLGAAGFTAKIYPAAVKAQVTTSWLTLCPSPDGIQTLNQNASTKALAILRQLGQPANASASRWSGAGAPPASQPPPGRVFTGQLRMSDRAFWPRLARGRGLGVATWAARAPVIWSGPLRAYQPARGSPGYPSALAAGCGSRVALDTWVVISGRADGPARVGETFFLQRRGHLLLYGST